LSDFGELAKDRRSRFDLLSRLFVYIYSAHTKRARRCVTGGKGKSAIVRSPAASSEQPSTLATRHRIVVLQVAPGRLPPVSRSSLSQLLASARPSTLALPLHAA